MQIFAGNCPVSFLCFNSILDHLRELELAAGGLSRNVEENSEPIQLVSREGPTTEVEVGKKKKKKGRDRAIPERGFKTYHLDEAIESWQMKFKDVQEEFRKMDKKDRIYLKPENLCYDCKIIVIQSPKSRLNPLPGFESLRSRRAPTKFQIAARRSAR